MKGVYKQIILASASPRRKELMQKHGFDFIADPSGAQEGNSSEDCLKTALSNAKLKAMEIAEKYPKTVVLGADTIVVLDGKLFGKPKDLKEAKEMLNALQGRTHSVFTAIAIILKSENILETAADESRVSFKKMDMQDIENYLKKVNVLDKAGAYAAQEFGELIIEKIDGDFENVMGLPCSLLKNELGRIFGSFKIFLK